MYINNEFNWIEFILYYLLAIAVALIVVAQIAWWVGAAYFCAAVMIACTVAAAILELIIVYNLEGIKEDFRKTLEIT